MGVFGSIFAPNVCAYDTIMFWVFDFSDFRSSEDPIALFFEPEDLFLYELPESSVRGEEQGESSYIIP